jgi:hypothetical protein
VAFGVDIGYIVLVRAQLQNAVDSAAMAAVPAMIDDVDGVYNAANEYAAKHWAGGQYVALETSDVEIGTWDVEAGTFTPSGGNSGNAVRVTGRRLNVPLFFGAVLGRKSFDAEAQAVAMSNPRDICFVVDLSGSMNDDTEPVWVTSHIDSTYAAEYGNVGSDLMQDVYEDFNFGTYPGTLEYLGATLSVPEGSGAYATMTANGGQLAQASIPVAYRILNTDNEATRKHKCYSWIMDTRLTAIMPNALPAIDSTNTTSYNYWERYIDYVIRQSSAGSRGTIPSIVNSTYRVTGLNNPNGSSYPDIPDDAPNSSRNYFGYKTYVSFMMDLGRDVTAAGTYTPLSLSSTDCPLHTESVGDDSFSFPPREQPTHASRRSMIAAMQVVEEMNTGIANTNVRDWVSVITFDKTSPGPVVAQALTGEYDDAKEACASLQAVGDNAASTATESGLIAAHDHITDFGRANTGKVVVLLTDGVPNLYSSSGSDISSYMSANSSSNFYSSGSSNNAKNAPLMQADIMRAGGYYLYSVGLGLGTDYDFMDRMARMGDTANDDGETFRGSGNPTDYEAVLTDIFEQIIRSPKARLVK